MQKEMMLAFLLTLVACFSAKADLNEKIETLNSAVKSVGAPKSDCETCTTMVAGKPEDDGSLMQSCVESICGANPLSLTKTMDSVYQKAAAPQPTFEAEIQPLIQAIAASDAADKLARAQSIREWIKTAKPLEDPGAIRFFNLLTAYGESTQLKLTVNDKGETTIDRVQSRAALPNLSEAEFDRKMVIYSKILSTMGTSAIAETDPAKIKIMYEDRFPLAVSSVLNEIDSQRIAIEGNPEFQFLKDFEAFQTLSSTTRLRTAFSGGQVDPSWIAELNNTASVMKLFTAMAYDPALRAALPTEAIDVKKQYRDMGIGKLLQDRIARQSQILKSGAQANSPLCRTALALAQEVLPTQTQIDAFKSRVPDLREKFKKGTQKFVCESSSVKAQKMIDEIEPVFPMTQEQYLKTLMAALKRAQADSAKARSKTDAVMKSPHKNVWYSIGLSSLRESENEPTASSDEVCRALIVDPTPDATTYEGKTFVAGPLAIQHSHAEGACHHELGHKLSLFLKFQSDCDKAGVKKVSHCLVDNHSELSENEKTAAHGALNYGYESTYGEEDWADLLSAQIAETSNQACVFALQTKKENYKTLSLRNTNSADKHSSSLFRLLHIEALKNGKLPATCEAALSAKGERAQFKNCLAQ